jgi:ABC-type antimicrobial peptide transport system permease subunit
VRFSLHARVRDARALAALERTIRAVDPHLAVSRATPLAARLDEALIAERLAQWAGLGVGIAQFALALTALWSLIAYTVARRRGEMGIRLALGATPRSLVRLAVRPALLLIAAGAALGTAAGVAGAAAMQSAFAGLAALRPAATLPVVLLYLAVAGIAAWWPARRAARIDPMDALRAE